MIDIKMQVSGDGKSLIDALAAKHPFATALALTRAAQAGQQAVRDHMADAFILRNKFTQNQVRIVPAKKADLESAVYLTEKAGYMALHETGGVKEPHHSSSVAVPTEGVRRNKRGLIQKSNRPRPLRDQRRVFVIQFSDFNGGQRAIARRKGKKRYPISILYWLVEEAKIAPMLHMREIVQRIAVTEFTDLHHKALLAELKR